MKKIFLGLVVPAAFVLAMLLGSKARFQSYVTEAVDTIRPQARSGIADAPAVVSTKTSDAEASEKKKASLEAAGNPQLEHGNGPEKILRTRELMRLKQYERVVLKPDQRESFKKVFLDIALNPKSDWLTQRQALRNLYLHKVELSMRENDQLMATVDQRAMASVQSTDAELLKEAVNSL